MKYEVKLGEVGTFSASFTGGKGRLEIAAKVPGNVGIDGGAFIEGDSDVVLDALFGLIEKHSPAGLVPIEEGAKAIIKANVKALP